LFFDSPPYAYPFIDPVLIFAVVMFLLALVPILADWLRAPRIVFYIIAGAISGPHVLNFLHRDETMILLGTIGLLYLIFLAGLQLDLNKFIKQKYQSLSFGFITFLLPFTIGTLVGIWLGYSIYTALLLASLFASHTLIAYPIVSRLGIVKNRAMTSAIGGIMVTDPGALLVLAVVIGAHTGDISLQFWLMLGISVTAYLLIIYFLVPVIGQWFFRNSKSGGAVEFSFVIAVLFLCAYLADVAGLEPIIGAFLAGLALNRLIPENSVLMNRTRFVGEALFIPIFLLSVGMLVDISAFFTDFRTWIVAIAMIIAVHLGKGGAAFIAKKTFRFSSDEAWTIFGLTLPQAAATLAVTLIAYDIGLFDDYILNGTIMMILITCLIGPWLVEKYGRRVAIHDEQKPYESSEAPQRILVPLANPETSTALMDIAFMIRDPNSDQPIYPLTVARDGSNVESHVARGEKMLTHAVLHAAAAEVPVNPVTRVDLNVASGVARAVSERRITTVVIGWNGEVSATRRIFGFILDKLLEELDETIMVTKIERPVNTYDRVVVAIPPFAELESGFSEVMHSIKLMAEQIGGALLMVATNERKSTLKSRVDEVKPSLDIVWADVATWSEFPKWLDSNRDENDLLFLMSARGGSLSWRPGLDRLPRVIAQRYPDLSFITVYPAEREVTSDSNENRQKRKILQEHRIKIDLEPGEIRDVLKVIMEGDSGLDHIESERITKRLLENSSGYTPEVMPGVFLFESHTSKVHEQMLFVGVVKDGVNVEQTANPAYVILVLLSPVERSAQEHLEALNRVVKLIRSADHLEKIRQAETVKEVTKLLHSQE